MDALDLAAGAGWSWSLGRMSHWHSHTATSGSSRAASSRPGQTTIDVDYRHDAG